MLARQRLRSALGFALALSIAVACDSSTGSVAPETTPVEVELPLPSLSGIIQDERGTPLAGVVITTAAGASARTDSQGVFTLVQLDAATTQIVVDGRFANDAASSHPPVTLEVELFDGRANVLDRPIVLPNYVELEEGRATVALDEEGRSTEPLVVEGAPPLVLRGPPGTAIEGEERGAAQLVEIASLAVADLPVALPDGRAPAALVVVSPEDAVFSFGAERRGLDVEVEDQLALPPGTELQVLFLDPARGQWTDVTADTGPVSAVEGAATPLLLAAGAVTRGGWYAFVLRPDVSCTTTVSGQVLSAIDNAPVPGVSVVLSTGQFQTTDFDGLYSIPDVPAFVVGDAACDRIPLTLEFTSSPFMGTATETVTLAAGNIVRGGETEVDTVLLPLTDEGSVAGLLAGPLTPGAEVVFTPLAGGDSVSVLPTAQGSFSTSGVTAGAYTASYLFLDDVTATEGLLEVGPAFLTTIVLQSPDGVISNPEIEGPPPPPEPPTTADNLLRISVFETSSANIALATPVAATRVSLVSAETGAGAVLSGITGSDGRVVFSDVTGPFHVTAQRDVATGSAIVRQATSIVDLQAPSGELAVLFRPLPTPLGSLSGSITGILTGLSSAGHNARIFVDGEALPPAPLPVGFFSIPAPLDRTFDLVVTEFDEETDTVLRFTVARDLLLDAGNPALVLDQNLLSSDAVQMFNSANIVFDTGGLNVDLAFAEFVMADQDHREIARVPLEIGSQAPFPDVAHPSLTPLRLSLRLTLLATTPTGTQALVCTQTLESINGDFDFVDLPVFQAPTAGSTLTVDELEELEISLAPPPTDDFGINVFSIEGTAPPGIADSLWTIYAPQGSDRVTLPATELPMIVPGSYSIEARFERFSGPSGFAFGDFLDSSLPQVVRTLFDATDRFCWTSESIQVISN